MVGWPCEILRVEIAVADAVSDARGTEVGWGGGSAKGGLR